MKDLLLVLMTLASVGLLCGCSDSKDQSSGSDGAPMRLSTVLDTWEAGQIENAVEQFVSVSWDDPSAFQDISVFNVSPEELAELPQNERNRLQQDAHALAKKLQKIFKNVLGNVAI